MPFVDQPVWATAPWQGGDKPYQQIEASVDRLFASSSVSTTLLQTYQNTADQNHSDPQAQFRWAYASYRAREATPPIVQRQSVGLGALERATFPGSYRYARLCFLVGTQFGPNPYLKDAGQRLLRRGPNDYDVEYSLARSFDPTRSPQATHLALSYAQDLLKKKPNDARSYSALGGIYYYLWLVKHDKADGERAVQAYQHYLTLHPPSDKKRKLAQRIIDDIRKSG